MTKKTTASTLSVLDTADLRGKFSSLETHLRSVQEEIEELQILTAKLLDVGVAITAEIDLYSLLTRIIEEAKGLLKAEKGTLYLVDHETMELYFHVTDAEQLKEIRIPVNETSISGYVALTSQPLNLPDVYRISPDSPYKFNKRVDRTTGYRTKSMLTVPMVNHEGYVTGCVQLINRTVNGHILPFSERDQRILSSLASQAAVAIENAQLYKEVADLFDAFVKFSASAIDERDPATAGHSRRVAQYAIATARSFGCFSEEQLKELEYAAWLHDIGKIGVREHILIKKNKLYPDEFESIRERFESIRLSAEKHYFISLLKLNPASPSYQARSSALKQKLDDKLSQIDNDLQFITQIDTPGYMPPEKIAAIKKIAKKSFVTANGEKRNYLTPGELEKLSVTRGNLTESEREIMNAHVVSTYKILSAIPFSRRLRLVPAIAASHHERIDGTGYPNRLRESDITLQGRILALVDVFDALTAQDRPYKPAIPIDKSVNILRSEVESGKLDPDVFRMFIANNISDLAKNQ